MTELLDIRTPQAQAIAAAQARGMIAIGGEIDGFMLIDLATRQVIAGERFELTSADVLRICEGERETD